MSGPVNNPFAGVQNTNTNVCGGVVGWFKGVFHFGGNKAAGTSQTVNQVAGSVMNDSLNELAMAADLRGGPAPIERKDAESDDASKMQMVVFGQTAEDIEEDDASKMQMVVFGQTAEDIEEDEDPDYQVGQKRLRITSRKRAEAEERLQGTVEKSGKTIQVTDTGRVTQPSDRNLRPRKKID